MTHADAWDEIYQRFGANPQRETPSIKFLLDRAAKGVSVRSINPLVDIMNIVSLRHGLPCGGDDLDSLDTGGVELTLAEGDETFTSLAKPDKPDPPLKGEAVYLTLPKRRVMCRRLNWRNSDFSKITSATTNVVINIDALLSIISVNDLRNASSDLADLVRRHCGGEITAHYFSILTPKVEV